MLTIPNLISLLRLLGAPLFLWVYLRGGSHLFAFAILAIGGATDYLDGKLARVLNQTSRLGEILDPAIDRIYLASILIAFALKEVLPIWLVFLVLGRDLILALLSAARKQIVKVTFLGKAATFNLLYSLPFLLIDQFTWAKVLGWSFAIWGIGLYLLTGLTYSLGLLRLRRN